MSLKFVDFQIHFLEREQKYTCKIITELNKFIPNSNAHVRI